MVSFILGLVFGVLQAILSLVFGILHAAL